MKTLTYLLAAIGLLFLGALVHDMMEQENPVTGHLQLEPLAAMVLPEGEPDTVVSPRVRRIPKSIDHPGTVVFPPEVQIPSAIAHPVVQHNPAGHTTVVHTSWAKLGLITIIGMLFCTVAIGALFGLKKLIHGSAAHRGQDSGAVQELFVMGKGLEARMESLETILLERTRTPR